MGAGILPASGVRETRPEKENKKACKMHAPLGRLMKPPRPGLFSLLTDLAIRLTGHRRSERDIHEDVRRAAYRTDTRGMGVRMTSFLRDRLRRGWLRIRRDD
jgi:hypothetical protein